MDLQDKDDIYWIPYEDDLLNVVCVHMLGQAGARGEEVSPTITLMPEDPQEEGATCSDAEPKR